MAKAARADLHRRARSTPSEALRLGIVSAGGATRRADERGRAAGPRKIAAGPPIAIRLAEALALTTTPSADLKSSLRARDTSHRTSPPRPRTPARSIRAFVEKARPEVPGPLRPPREETSGPSASSAPADHAGGQALLGRRSASGKLMLPKCQALRARRSSTRASLCPALPLAATSRWIQASGRGKLYSFEISYQTVQPGLQGAAAATCWRWSELEEGPRMMSNLINVAPDPKAHPLRHAGRGRLRPSSATTISAAAVPAGEAPDERELRNTGLHRRRRRERRDRHPARTRASSRLHLEAITNAVRDAGLEGLATSTASSPPASTPRPLIGEALGITPARTSTAPPSAAAPSSSWSATPWPRCTTASATWP